MTTSDAEPILIHGGPIYTIEADLPKAEALLAVGGQIAYVGDLTSARALAPPHTRELDLRGRVAFPGFVESHSHPFHLGRNLSGVACAGAGDIATIVERLRERAQSTPKGEWVIGHGFDDTGIADNRHLTAADLDAASREHPIFVTHVSGHSAYANSVALARAGVDASTADPDDGHIDRDAAGNPTGILWEWALKLVVREIPADTVDAVKAHVEAAAQVYLGVGITSVTEAALGLAGDGRVEFDALNALAEDGTLPIRLGAALTYELWRSIYRGSQNPPEWRGDTRRVRPMGVKLFQDGSIQLRTAALSCCYHGMAARADVVNRIRSQEQLDEVVRDIHTAGWQILTHANGDDAIDCVLNAYARVLPPGRGHDIRHRIEHCQTARDDQIERMAGLGVPASVFAAHVYYWGDRHRDLFLGPRRASRISPLSTLLKYGVPFGLHNDSPVTPPSPLASIATASSRRTSAGEILGPEQAITVHQALRAMTIDSAWLSFDENTRGSLRKGKLADIVILDQDPYRVAPAEIADINVDKTIVGGAIVFDRE